MILWNQSIEVFFFLQLVLMTFVKDVRDGFMLVLETGWSTGNLPF